MSDDTRAWAVYLREGSIVNYSNVVVVHGEGPVVDTSDQVTRFYDDNGMVASFPNQGIAAIIRADSVQTDDE